VVYNYQVMIQLDNEKRCKCLQIFKEQLPPGSKPLENITPNPIDTLLQLRRNVRANEVKMLVDLGCPIPKVDISKYRPNSEALSFLINHLRNELSELRKQQSPKRHRFIGNSTGEDPNINLKGTARHRRTHSF
ncbi:unnamed protein product, partial [marine sediment metagenome]